MQRIKDNKGIILFILIFFVIGFTIGRITDWSYFVFDNKISVIDVLSLAITSFLAIYIAKIIEREKQNAQSAKQSYIDKLIQCEQLLFTITNLIEEKNVSYGKINNTVHIFRMKLNNTIEYITEKDDHFKNFEIDKNMLENKTKELKDLLTNTPIDKTDNSNIVIRNNKVTYSEKRVLDINKVSASIENELFNIRNKIIYF